MAGRRGIQVDVDDRTDQMTLQALLCRRYGHAWMPVPQGAKRRAALLKLGQTESVNRCIRDCGVARVELIDLDSWEVISRRMEYPEEGYLMTGQGTGRLPRSEARKAIFARNVTMV